MSAFATIVGNLGGDPKFDTTAGGTAVAKFAVAVSIYKGKDKESVTNWYAVAVFGKAADSVRDWKKGDHVQVMGDLEARPYEKDGEKRVSLDLSGVKFTNFSKFVNGGRGGGDSTAASRPAPAPRPAPSKEALDDLPF